jgi:aqualysin 1
MRRTILLLTVALAMSLACAGIVWAHENATSELQQNPTQSAIPGQYIVVLEEGVSDSRMVAQEHAQRYGARLLSSYEHALKGYAARIPDRRLDDVRADSRVAYVESDKVAYAEAQKLPWGIDRVQADRSSSKAGNGSGAVSKVHAYIIDTGIYRHADLNVVKHVNFARDGKNRDCHGHGTHVAGIAAAKDNHRAVVGVAPGAPLTGVKVLNCSAKGTASGLIKGVDWVTAHAKKPAIANMSVGLGGNPSDALDDAVRKSARSGVFYSLAAGNKGTGLCGGSPARTGAGTNNGIATVAATDRSNQETSWSNYGKCVDIWAPGAKIRSTKVGGGTTMMGGTSMAAPHVGGGGALYLSKNSGASSSSVESALKSAATKPGTRSKGGRSILLENVKTF